MSNYNKHYQQIEDLSRENLLDIVHNVYEKMFLDWEHHPDCTGTPFYNPDKSIEGADLIQDLAETFERHYLTPEATDES